MTTGEYPTAEEADISPLDPESARLVTDAIHILRHPAVQPLMDLDMEDRELLGQTKFLAQQSVISYMMVQGIIGNQSDMSTKEIMDTHASAGALTLSLRATNQFHNAYTAYARAQGKTGLQQAGDIIRGNVDENMTLAVRDLANLYHQGLVTADGTSDNMQYASSVLRFLNVNLLFGGQADTQDVINEFYDRLYEAIVGQLPNDGQLNLAAQKYASQYAKPLTRGNAIRSIRRKAGPLVDEITNRAALQVLFANAKGTLEAVEDQAEARRKYVPALRAIGRAEDIVELNASMANLIDRLQAAAAAEGDVLNADDLAESLVQATHLDWEVLPPGELEERARAIVREQSRSSTEVTIDLERLKILDNIRKQWGEGASYYAYGKLGKRRIVKHEGQEEPDQYLLLILQEFDETGQVVREHAVAESPIAGPNALYVFRQDVSEGLSWRDVMALPKHYARSLKARAVKHTKPRQAAESFLVTAMTKKVGILLACEADEFLVLEFSGERGVRLPRRAITGEANDDQ